MPDTVLTHTPLSLSLSLSLNPHLPTTIIFCVLRALWVNDDLRWFFRVTLNSPPQMKQQQHDSLQVCQFSPHKPVRVIGGAICENVVI